ncbi:MAG: NUDIX domain-containing protein [Candidatus Delongbacteria bacterium]|nr:NUDIX domain-containing protein [Candidatus Delongbacteria bacterium]MCG2760313.1 NUDIX domain-containing protein [Candidatus Delongbacteria bacterium]
MIENIARAVIIKNNKILLAKQKDKNYTFLPGGHIEFGETVTDALNRELFEELGITGNCGLFVCAIENVFEDNSGKSCHEMGFYFSYLPDDRYSDDDFESKEDHLVFLWVDIRDLRSFNLQPKELILVISDVWKFKDTPGFISAIERPDTSGK